MYTVTLEVDYIYEDRLITRTYEHCDAIKYVEGYFCFSQKNAQHFYKKENVIVISVEEEK